MSKILVWEDKRGNTHAQKTKNAGNLRKKLGLSTATSSVINLKKRGKRRR